MTLKVNAAQYADKWKRRMDASGQDMRQGIERVTEAPGVKAAAKADKMRQGILDAIDSGKWASNVANVSLSDWKTATIDKGIPRISAGVAAAMPKQVVMAGKLLAAVESAADQVNAMPDTTFEQRMQKMIAFSTSMHEQNIKG